MKIEFAVLNQLMAVAARGLQKENFEERRYHHGSAADAFSAECRDWDKKRPDASKKELYGSQEGSQDLSHSTGSFQITTPSPVLSRQHQTASTSATESEIKPSRSHPPALQSTDEDEVHDHEKFDRHVSQTERGCHLGSFLDDNDAANGDDPDLILHKPSEAFSGETLRLCAGATREESPHLYPRLAREARKQAIQSLRHPPGHHRQYRRQHDDRQDGSGLDKGDTRALIKGRIPDNGRHSKPDEDEEEMGVHMWENRKGSLMMEVPWFKSKAEP